MILIIDNYDSFTWNLVDLIRRSAPETLVKRNDKITLEEIEKLGPKGIVISPGPGKPEDSGISSAIVADFSEKIPILGVCMGMQVLATSFGAKLIHAREPYHGKTSQLSHDGKGIFSGIKTPMEVMRYHSLIVDPESVNGTLEISAKLESGEIMALRHKKRNLVGVQFHPESILSPLGEKIIQNWLDSL